MIKMQKFRRGCCRGPGENLHTNHIMMKERNIRYTNVGLQRRGEKENPVRDIGDRCIIVSLCLCVCSMNGGGGREAERVPGIVVI